MSEKPAILSTVNLFIVGAVFILGIGLGVLFSSSTSSTTGNIATRYDLDKMAPNPEICAQFGASAVAMDMRAFVTLNPIAVYISRPKTEPGCILRSSNWSILQQRNLIDQKAVNECRNRMNTFGFVGDLDARDPKVDCVYQNDAAENLFLNQSGGSAPPPETERF
ncbi:MAG TPA: DUF3172 domain-containing protein [Chroococcidiopsis sp.]